MNLRQTHRIKLCFILCVIMLLTACSAAIRNQVNHHRQLEPMSQKDINTVLKVHEAELLAIPGVVGIYIGLLPDDQTTCLKVMVAEKTEEIQKRIPESIEGYPVLIEESGVIHPLKSNDQHYP